MAPASSRVRSPRSKSITGWRKGSTISRADFEGGERGLRLSAEGLKQYLRCYEEQLRSPSEGGCTPSWRRRIVDQGLVLQKMVMSGEAAPLYVWRGQ